MVERDGHVSFQLLTMKEDVILDLAIDYVQYECYSQELMKEKKRAVWKRATKLVMERGKVCAVYLRQEEC